MFGRATITLGIGPHSSFTYCFRHKQGSRNIRLRPPMLTLVSQSTVHDLYWRGVCLPDYGQTWRHPQNRKYITSPNLGIICCFHQEWNRGTVYNIIRTVAQTVRDNYFPPHRWQQSATRIQKLQRELISSIGFHNSQNRRGNPHWNILTTPTVWIYVVGFKTNKQTDLILSSNAHVCRSL